MHFLRHAAALLVLLSSMWVAFAQPRPAAPNRHLLIVLDGLRPDYVTPALMPRLHALGQRGVVFERHHSVFPTVTRVNASSISTGAHPATHGLMGNSVFFPGVDAAKFLDTSDRANLLAISASEKGRLLTAATMGEAMQAAGHRLLVISAGSTGSAFLLNHTVAGGAILHPEFGLPEALYAEMRAKHGAPPASATPNNARNHYIVDAFLTLGIPKIDPTVTVMWLGDPDGTAHELGIGHPTTTDALRLLDVEIGRIQEGLAAAGLLERYNIWVTSDHGFSTHTGGVDLGALLKPFAGEVKAAGGGAIYLRDSNTPAAAAIVGILQKTPGIGAIFTRASVPGRPGELDGRVPGTLSFEAAHWSHVRSADILFSPDWTDAKNQYGWAGTAASGGVAGHGSASPFDIHNTLVAAGPDLRQKTIVQTPTGNVDFAPTFLNQLGVNTPPSMQGRVLREALRGGPEAGSVGVRSDGHTAKSADGRYSVTAHFSIVDSAGGQYRYLDYASGARRR